jgi:phosphoribulokinase
MSRKHPIIAVTGSSGAGTTTVKVAFEHIFLREGVNPVVIEGDSYHRYDRVSMKEAMNKAERGKYLRQAGGDLQGLRRDRHLRAPLLSAQR